MQRLIELVELTRHETEVGRVMQICNACRYCEGFCGVFPAMTRRIEFARADIHFLANLCHNCGACLHACQYAPPHEFAVNVPQAMARVRGETYEHYAWPAPLGALYRRNGITVALALAAGFALFLALALLQGGSLWRAPNGGNFYAVFPHGVLVTLFGAVFGWAVLALTIGVARFWRDSWRQLSTASPRPEPGQPVPVMAPAIEAGKNALALTYLDGGHGEGCHEEDDRPTLWRRRWHHLTFWGFMLCFASTSVATVYHYGFGWQAPYSLTSLPVILGTLGGLGLLAGPAGLAWLSWRRHPAHGDAAQRPMDRGFIALLFFTALTGLALLAWRDTSAMTLLLVIHLGVVAALFATLPYGKFAHAPFRLAALFKHALERRLPDRLRLGAD
ncbi:MAG: tricarballylate utilization 4Fe-4S protein TcuB [Burkholderiales bacterium]|nr:tricarballylate utilization 4Fe-4S protein TcuB [Burkholderiales bacterium]